MQYKEKELKCKFCLKVLEVSDRAWNANPFCNDKDCYERRLEASGAVDLRDNHEIIDLMNGYVQINPIDSDKKWRSESRNII